MSEEKAVFYDFGEFRLDLLNCRLLKNGSPVQLTHKSFEILHELIEKRNRMLKKEELLNKIWNDCYVEEATLTQHIYMLRKVLQQNGNVYIETIPKNGYRFVAEVREVFPETENPNEQKITEQHEFSQKEPEILLPEEKFVKDSEKIEDLKFKKDESVFRKNDSEKKFLISIFAVFCVFVIFTGLYFYLRGGNLAPTPIASREIKSIAVLPFKHIAEQRDEKLGLGMADVLITKLGKAQNLEVLPTSSIIRYAEQDGYNLTEVGKNLDVDAVLTGTIQYNEDVVRVNVQFYNVSTQSFLWSEKYDEKLTNIFSLQDSISERVFKELALRMNIDAESETADRYTKNIEAHQAYSMGLFHWNSRTREGLNKAIAHFQNAVKFDPNFALGYAYLADTYSLIAYYNLDSNEDVLQKAREAARKALEIDPNCSEAMTALATINTGENRIEESFNLLKRAIEIKPNNVAARQRIAWMYAHNNNLEKALEEMKTAQHLDPQARATNIALAQLLNVARRPDEAKAFSKRVLEFNPKDETAKLRLAESFEQKGNFDEAQKLIREILHNDQNDTDALVALGRVLAKTGDKKSALEIVKKISQAKTGDDYNYEIALVYTVFGENEKAVELLKKSTNTGGFIKLFLRNDYNLDPLRENEEFVKIAN